VWGAAGEPELAWTFTSPRPDLSWLEGLVAFDHDRVRVEIIDPVHGEETVKRFPTWGDTTDLVDMLDVRPEGDGRYVSVTRDSPNRPVVEASQMLAQAIVAAGRYAPGRRTVSAHMVFARVGATAHPLELELEEISSGRSFTALLVHVSQGGRRLASGTLLLDATSPEVMRHAVEPPTVPGPMECPTNDMGVTGRDLRFVDDAYPGTAESPAGPPVIDGWMRYRDVPDDPYLHAALLVQFTGHIAIAAAMRPHEGIGQEQAHRTLSTGINAIGVSLHADVRADDWMLFRHQATFAGDGMTHSECRVHDEGGALLASFTVDAMVRPMRGDPSQVDHRTAL
jgi:acyl-CoA thioesterase